jgi:hypothetical protein
MKMNDFGTWCLSLVLAVIGFCGLAATNNPGAMYLGGSVPYDHDATNFIARAGINRRGAEAKAIGQLVNDLKQANLWTNFYALYPFVGSGSNSCAQNLVSTNYTVTWSGTNTFTSYGVTGDGVSGSGDTHFIESSTGVNTNNIHFYAYVVKHQAGSSGGFISAGQNNAWGGVGSSSANIGFIYPNSQGGIGIATGIGHAFTTRQTTNSTYGLLWVAPFRSSDYAYLSNLLGSALTGVVTNSAKICGDTITSSQGLGPSKSTIATASVGRYLSYQQATNLFVIINRFESALRRNTSASILTP